MTRVEDIWPDWATEERLGNGAYGTVWRASRTVLGHTSLAAVKIIEFPQDESEVAQLRAMGMGDDDVREYLMDMAREVMREVATMDELKGAPHVVGVDDYRLVEREGGLAIGIRMELLEDLQAHYARVGQPSQAELARLGMDVCVALEACHARGIIHRDIKPQNVFVDEYGYLLGDFGIARQLERAGTVLSQRGTRSYMAPEVFFGRPYGSSVDIYSLGLMLWRLLNGGVPPFVDATTGRVGPVALQEADERRIRGEALPAPAGADPELAAIVLKACSPVPQDRWPSARLMREALSGWLAGAGEAARAAAPAAAATTAAEDEATDGGYGQTSVRAWAEATSRTGGAGAVPAQVWAEATSLVDSLGTGTGTAGQPGAAPFLPPERTTLVDSVGDSRGAGGSYGTGGVGALYFGAGAEGGGTGATTAQEPTAVVESQAEAPAGPTTAPQPVEPTTKRPEAVEAPKKELVTKGSKAERQDDQKSVRDTHARDGEVRVRGFGKWLSVLLFLGGAALSMLFVIHLVIDYDPPLLVPLVSSAALFLSCAALTLLSAVQPKGFGRKMAIATAALALLWAVLPFVNNMGRVLRLVDSEVTGPFITMNAASFLGCLPLVALFCLACLDRPPLRKSSGVLLLVLAVATIWIIWASNISAWNEVFYDYVSVVHVDFSTTSYLMGVPYVGPMEMMLLTTPLNLGLSLFGWRLQAARTKAERES